MFDKMVINIMEYNENDEHNSFLYPPQLTKIALELVKTTKFFSATDTE